MTYVKLEDAERILGEKFSMPVQVTVMQALRSLPTDDGDSEYAEMIRDACMSGDFENDHCNADNILRAILIEIGFSKTLDAYNEVGKWYA